MSESTTDLAVLSQSIEDRLRADRPEEAAALARKVLLRLPRHLATYQRLLRAAWMLKRWQEGEEWARRLLQADPGNALAWRSLAWAVEQKNMRNAARAMWQRAFQADPYDPEIRSGLSRTSLEEPNALMLDAGGLASLYMRGCRWQQAAATYQSLVEADVRRIDFQVNWMVALWQQGARREAYQIARRLSARHPYLIMSWAVLNALGDVDDKALARNPIKSMDPDGEFVHMWLGLPYDGGKATSGRSIAPN